MSSGGSKVAYMDRDAGGASGALAKRPRCTAKGESLNEVVPREFHSTSSVDGDTLSSTSTAFTSSTSSTVAAAASDLAELEGTRRAAVDIINQAENGGQHVDSELVITRGPSKIFYTRNNKTPITKHLRCFPSCRSGGHATGKFCGTALTCLLHMDKRLKAYRGQGLSAVGEFCTEDSLTDTQAPTKQDTLEESRFFVGAIERQEMVANSLTDMFSITFDPPAWQYSWKSNRWSPSTQHVFVVYIFLDGQECPIMRTISSPFSIFSARRFVQASEADTEPENPSMEARASSPISKSRKVSVSTVLFPEMVALQSASPSNLPSTRRSPPLRKGMTSTLALNVSDSNEMNICIVDADLASESDILMRGEFLAAADMADPHNWECVSNPTTDLWLNDRPGQELFSEQALISFSKPPTNIQASSFQHSLPLNLFQKLVSSDTFMDFENV